MTAIDADLIVSAFLVIAIGLAVISIPHLLYIMIRSSVVANKHLAARDVDEDNMTKSLAKYVAARSDKLIFHKIVSDELDRLSGMKDSVPLAASSAAIILVMIFWPGFSGDAMTFAVILFVLLLACIIGSYLVTMNVMKKYAVMLEEDAQDNVHPEEMYG